MKEMQSGSNYKKIYLETRVEILKWKLEIEEVEINAFDIEKQVDI